MKIPGYIILFFAFCSFSDNAGKPATIDPQLLVGTWTYDKIYVDGVEDPGYMAELDSECYVFDSNSTYQRGRIVSADSIAVWWQGNYSVNLKNNGLSLLSDNKEIAGEYEVIQELTATKMVWGFPGRKFRKSPPVVYYLVRVGSQ